ncbi:hypothetical protein COL516b_003435 [Colletotrichum fioriniae]|nr:uncharacterized protein COL516b_003435 [Colletotrichum fioriniae]KAJ0308880.1 hypothetical protein COL516b_003435 [Colletotrichum fioriniae]
MPRPKVPESQRQRAAEACRFCREAKKKFKDEKALSYKGQYCWWAEITRILRAWFYHSVNNRFRVINNSSATAQ